LPPCSRVMVGVEPGGCHGECGIDEDRPCGGDHDMGRISLFHGTTKTAAEQIQAHGFRDATGTYMTSGTFTGTWFADRPLDGNEGACSEAYFEVQIECALVEEYEWIEEGKPYREFLVPARIINEHGTIIRREDLDC